MEVPSLSPIGLGIIADKLNSAYVRGRSYEAGFGICLA